MTRRPSFSESQTLTQLWSGYQKALGPLLKLVPELLTAGRALLTVAPLPADRAEREARQKERWRSLARFLGGRRNGFRGRTAECLVFHSSFKPYAQPGLDRIAETLAGQGFRVAIITAENRLRYFLPGENGVRVEEDPAFHAFIREAEGFLDGLVTGVRAVLSFGLLYAAAGLRDQACRQVIASNPLGVFEVLLRSIHRLRHFKTMLRDMSPRLLLVSPGVHVPVAAELLRISPGTGSRRIWLCNEDASPALSPCDADEVFLRNAFCAEELAPLLAAESPVLTVTGSSELGASLSEAVPENPRLKALLRRAGDRPIFLVLSEFTQIRVGVGRDIAQELSGWLAVAARKRPEWYFVIKSRPYHHDLSLPGEDLLLGLDNLEISRDDASFSEFLHQDVVRAVGAWSSSGLYVAAGFGKAVCRLRCRPEALVPRAAIDTVSRQVGSATELAAFLAELQEGRGAGPLFDRDSAFPWLGQELQHMAGLCRDRLVTTGGRS